MPVDMRELKACSEPRYKQLKMKQQVADQTSDHTGVENGGGKILRRCRFSGNPPSRLIVHAIRDCQM
jgi:hypothetical protein